MSELYSMDVLDHYRNPRNHGHLDPCDISHEEDNSLCGDRIRIDLRLDGDTIADIRFSGRGCAISQAATSMLTELVTGQNIATIRALTQDDLLTRLAVPLTPARLQCALLGLHVLKTSTLGTDDW